MGALSADRIVRRSLRHLAIAGLAMVLVACGERSDRRVGSAPPAADLTPAELRRGDVIVRASAVPTMQLNAAMARAYGVTPDPDQVLLVVGLRRVGAGQTGPGQPASGQPASGPATPAPPAGEASSAPGQEHALRGNVQAQAVDLLGGRQAIALREVRSDQFVDYIGTVRVAMPDTLRFFIEAQVPGQQPLKLQFHRDFFRPET